MPLIVACACVLLVCATFVLLAVEAVRRPRVAAAAVLLSIGGCAYYIRDHQLSHVPNALQVREVVYAEEESWGFGPGGNEVGIVVFRVPSHVARQIEQDGIAFFNTMPSNADQNGRGWRGSFDEFRRTPVAADHDRGRAWPVACAASGDSSFCVDVEPKVLALANEAVNAPGSFYAYGRIGMLVVSPQQRRVYFLYNS